jgi:hypothetical protein
MNSDPNILTLPESEQPSLQEMPLQDSAASGTDPVSPSFSGNCGKGKVARLPRNLREQINHLILDGVPYLDIIQRLGDSAKHITPDNIHQWKKYGYQDWLREREWLDRLCSKTEFSADILAAPDSLNLHEASLRVASSQMFDQLMRFNAESETAAPDQLEKFPKLVNALSRLTREALTFQKYRDACAQARAEVKKLYDVNRKLSDSERLAIVRHVDDILGIRHLPPDPKTEPLSKHEPTPKL